ncbi:uncharacterized protein LOC142978665 [Anticarsia gemmatalis]|uniref:uncharacterized protein LOC142978665 n=1 Tax=Anticarsia gemmatalis TaxID=129554 RepID=UPI003F76121F
MIMLLLVCILVLGGMTDAKLSDSPPPYLQAAQDLDTAASKLKQHILSMAGHIPELDDHRRHYADILHVVYKEGETQSGCEHESYYENYEKNVNIFAPEGILEPEKVISETQRLIDNFNNETSRIQHVIFTNCILPRNNLCDHIIDDAVNNMFLEEEAKIFLDGGITARAFLNKHKEFLAKSKELSVQEYILNGARVLEETVRDLGQLMTDLDHITCSQKQ